ncbi:hypothetical protein EV363DRAFT_1301529 [Boletus edulis]|nr:hypothetical protein EV363DRAFT_1301529 [Boletus edulis]
MSRKHVRFVVPAPSANPGAAVPDPNSIHFGPTAKGKKGKPSTLADPHEQLNEPGTRVQILRFKSGEIRGYRYGGVRRCDRSHGCTDVRSTEVTEVEDVGAGLMCHALRKGKGKSDSNGGDLVNFRTEGDYIVLESGRYEFGVATPWMSVAPRSRIVREEPELSGVGLGRMNTIWLGPLNEECVNPLVLEAKSNLTIPRPISRGGRWSNNMDLGDIRLPSQPPEDDEPSGSSGQPKEEDVLMDGPSVTLQEDADVIMFAGLPLHIEPDHRLAADEMATEAWMEKMLDRDARRARLAQLDTWIRCRGTLTAVQAEKFTEEVG